MKLMKLLIELGTALDAAQTEKADIDERVSDVDQAVAGIFGECEKTKAALTHTRCGRHITEHATELHLTASHQQTD